MKQMYDFLMTFVRGDKKEKIPPKHRVKSDMTEFDEFFNKEFNEQNLSSNGDYGYNIGNEDSDNYKHEVKFLLKKIVCKNGYDKWFTAIGVDIDTKTIISIPIRDYTVENFVEEHWGWLVDAGRIDEWDLYKILVKYSIPLIWSDNNCGNALPNYWVPVKRYTNRTWKRLKYRLKEEALCTSKHVDYKIWIN
jgi:hypothetical protein